MILLDTNYILRYLLADNEKMFQDAKAIIENHYFFILQEVIAEAVYVLEGVYKVPKEEVVEVLKKFILLENLSMYGSKDIMIEALHLYQDKNIDFVDSILCALKGKYEIKTFDKKLQKCLYP